MGASETVNTLAYLDEIYDCAVLWASADADYPDTPSAEWQNAYALMKAAPMLKDEVELLVDLIEGFYGGKTHDMTDVERFALKRSRKVLASLSPAKAPTPLPPAKEPQP